MDELLSQADELLDQQPPACPDGGDWCQQVFQITGNQWLAASADWLIAKPITIIIILLVAFLIRFMLKKLINRLTTLPESGKGKMPALLKPLREKAPAALSAQMEERRRQRAKTIGSVLKSFMSAVVLGIAVMVALGEIGLDLAPIIASAGVLGVALGFGAQAIVKDFLSGVFMMIEDQYGVGDWADLGEAAGTIEEVGLRVTTLRDLNGTVWYVRNGEVIRVGNYNQDFAYAVVDIPLGYRADVEHATALMREVGTKVISEPPIASNVLGPADVLGVQSVSVEGIIVRLMVKTMPGSQWVVERALRAEIMPALEEAGLEQPLANMLSNGNQGVF